MSAIPRARLSTRSGHTVLARVRPAPGTKLQLATEPGRKQSADSRRNRWESRLVFWIPLATFIAVGAVLVFHYASTNGDATARVANAYYMLFSRDPHLAAVGFVWNPLPSFTVLPLLPLKVLWPALSQRAFAGNLVSALFMAGAVWLIWRILVDLEVSRPVRLTLTALFFLNPMILYYGANGMSEGLFLFTLLLTTRHLVRWLDTDGLRSLVMTGVALGIAYLARNEAVTAAAAATIVVAAVRLVRAGGTLRRRFDSAIADAAIVSLPFVVCFVAWAVVSWVIVGHPFEQFSSVYGTSSQLRVAGAGIRSTQAIAAKPLFVTIELLSLAPFLLAVGTSAAVAALRRRDPRVLGLAAVSGGVLAFAVAAFIAGQTAGWYRYYITAVPLFVLLAGFLFADGRSLWPSWARGWEGRWAGAKVAWPLLLAVLVTAPGLQTTVAAMRNRGIGREEYKDLAAILDPGRHGPTQTADQDWHRSVVGMASFIDQLHLPSGSILVDTSSTCVPDVILAVHHPKVFIITNDRDFQPALADPVTFHVRFLMVPGQGPTTSLDAIVRAHPDPSADGFATLSHTFEARNPDGCPSFGLWSVRS